MRTVAALCRELLPDRRSDGELLAAFASERSESAFSELVRRHGPLVWGACRRSLPHPADAEDAFQAVFLVLVSQGRKLGTRDTLGPWLYRVAILTARNLRRKNARRSAKRCALPEDVAVVTPDPDLRADIDGALLALPARYRDPIILCHLQGLTRQEAAARLGCAEGTLSAWLSRGFAKLRVRLRDLDPARALSVPAVVVPAVLATGTVQAAVASGAAAAAIPPVVSSLVEGVLHMFWIKKATAATFALCAVFVVGVGVGLGTRTGSTGAAAQDRAGPPTDAPVERAKSAPPADNNKLVAEQLRVAEKQLLVRKGLAQAVGDKIDLMRQLDPKSKPAPEDLELLRRLEAELAPLEAERQALASYLAKLKNDKPTPAADKGGTKEQELDDLKAQLARIEAERARVLAQADTAKRQLAATEDQLRALEETIERVRQGGNRKPAADSHLELTVGGKDNTFVIREVRSNAAKGQPAAPLGPIATSDPAALAVLLARAKNDPNGPKSVTITVTEKATRESAQAAFDACKGYENIRTFSHLPLTIPHSGAENRRRPEANQPGLPAPESLNKADLDELLKRLKLNKTDLNKAEIDALLKKLSEELNRKPSSPKP